jgi:hypothetical protein
MERKEYLELAIEAAKVFGDLHDKGVINAADTVVVIGKLIVAELNDYLVDDYIEKDILLSDYSTKELHEALLQRAGVTEIELGLGSELLVTDKLGFKKQLNGPARIIVNID